MATKYLDKPITQSDLEAFIGTQDDFALELYAYSLAYKHGYSATHAGSYTDRITGKTRQFDVRASKQCGEDLHVFLAIESKCLRTCYPLLISQIRRERTESYQDIMQSQGRKRVSAGEAMLHGPRVLQISSGRSIYPPGAYVGKAVTQVGYTQNGSFVSGDSEVFDKWGQAIASLNDLIRSAAVLRDSEGYAKWSICVPVLMVPDDTLWTVNYAVNGSLEGAPTKSDHGEFYIGDSQTYVPNPDYLFRVSHLHVVTKSGLSWLLESFSEGGDRAFQTASAIPVA